MNPVINEFVDTFCDRVKMNDFAWKTEIKVPINVFIDMMIAECHHNQELISQRISTLGTDERYTQRKYYQNAAAFLKHMKMRLKGRFAMYALAGTVDSALEIFNPTVPNATVAISDTVESSGIGDSVGKGSKRSKRRNP